MNRAAWRIYTRSVNHDLQDSYRMCGAAYGRRDTRLYCLHMRVLNQ